MSRVLRTKLPTRTELLEPQVVKSRQYPKRLQERQHDKGAKQLKVLKQLCLCESRIRGNQLQLFVRTLNMLG